jgi:uncharacterized protein (DUF1697 family)
MVFVPALGYATATTSTHEAGKSSDRQSKERGDKHRCRQRLRIRGHAHEDSESSRLNGRVDSKSKIKNQRSKMKYVAFLRAINVGGRVVKMDVLRRLFTSMGFSGVKTFIASGNVIFESPARNAVRLEASIEKELAKALGYPVAVFLRPAPELSALAAHPLVCGTEVPEGCSLYVMFLRAEPAKETARKVASFSNDVDTLRVYERQVLWTVRGRTMDSTLSGAQLEKTLAMPATVRNATTVRKLAKIVAPEIPG